MKVRTRTLVAVALAGALSLAGCLDRKEKVTVHADGTVSVALTFKGDAGEFAAAAADRLPEGAPWVVRDADVARTDSGSDHVRTATGEFASAEAIPETFGAPDDPAPLHARTTVAMARTRDGKTRWTFERHYAPRARAWRQRLFDRFFPEELRKKLERKEGDPPLAEDLLRRAADALVAFEKARNTTLLERALDDAGTPADTLARLHARAAFEGAFDHAWSADDVLGAIRGTPEERAALDARYKQRTLDDAVKAGADALEAAAPGAARADLEARLSKAFAAARRVHDATEQLQLHTFEVKVELPARVVASDADALEDDGRTAVFKFSGADLCDQEHVLRAVAEAP